MARARDDLGLEQLMRSSMARFMLDLMAMLSARRRGKRGDRYRKALGAFESNQWDAPSPEQMLQVVLSDTTLRREPIPPA